MKNTTTILLLAAMVLSGCGVTMDAKYARLLDRTAAVSMETARRATAGTLSPAEMSLALQHQAVAWRLFQDARDGKAEPDSQASLAKLYAELDSPGPDRPQTSPQP